MNWIIDHFSTIIISLLLIMIVIKIIIKQIQSKNTCGCGCQGCALSSQCHKTDSKN